MDNELQAQDSHTRRRPYPPVCTDARPRRTDVPARGRPPPDALISQIPAPATGSIELRTCRGQIRPVTVGPIYLDTARGCTAQAQKPPRLDSATPQQGSQDISG